MRKTLITASLALAGSLSFAPAAMAEEGIGYAASDLLAPCLEADSDACNGIFAEIECEQFVMGFVTALKETGAAESMGICVPDQNTADELRWAFTRWVYESYSERTRMAASATLMGTLKDSFACQ